MSPTIVTGDGEPVLALGSPGGSTIITTVLQLLVDTVDLEPLAAGCHRRTARHAAQYRVDARRGGVHDVARGPGAR